MSGEVDKFGVKLGRIKSPRIDYLEKPDRNGKSLYLYDDRWLTAAGHAKRLDRDRRAVLKCIKMGIPLENHSNSMYVTNTGKWYTRNSLARIHEVSEDYISRRRVKVDGIWTINMSPEIEARRKEIFRQQRVRNAQKAHKVNAEKVDESGTVKHTWKGDKGLFNFATMARHEMLG